jgi:hypothetical protein
LREGVVLERDAFVESAFGDAEQVLEEDRPRSGGHAVERNGGYHRRDTASSSLLTTFVGVCSIARCSGVVNDLDPTDSRPILKHVSDVT